MVHAPFAILLRPRDGPVKQGAARRDVAQQIFQSCMQCERLTAEHNAKNHTCAHTFFLEVQPTAFCSNSGLAPQHLHVLLAALVVSATTGVSDVVNLTSLPSLNLSSIQFLARTRGLGALAVMSFGLKKFLRVST